MEPLRDWLIGRGWTSELATIAAVLAAFLVAYLIGWILRLLSKAPRGRLLKSEEWKEPLEQRQVVPRFMRVIVVAVARLLIAPMVERWLRRPTASSRRERRSPRGRLATTPTPIGARYPAGLK